MTTIELEEAKSVPVPLDGHRICSLKAATQQLPIPVHLLFFLLLTCHSGDNTGLREKVADRKREGD